MSLGFTINRTTHKKRVAISKTDFFQNSKMYPINAQCYTTVLLNLQSTLHITKLQLYLKANSIKFQKYDQ